MERSLLKIGHCYTAPVDDSVLTVQIQSIVDDLVYYKVLNDNWPPRHCDHMGYFCSKFSPAISVSVLDVTEAMAQVRAEGRAELTKEIEAHLKVSITALMRADYFRIAEVCRKTTGLCFCGIHITELDDR